MGGAYHGEALTGHLSEFALDITVKNYRCFSRAYPARISLGPGSTAFVGVNNSGKSSLLRLFVELRNLFGLLSAPSQNLLQALQGNRQAFGGFQHVVDSTEAFSRGNIADAQLCFEFETDASGKRQKVVLSVLLQREGQTWTAKLRLGTSEIGADNLGYEPSSNVLIVGSEHIDLTPFFVTAAQIAKSCYLPAFRNAINTGSGGDYYDMSVGQAFVRNFRDWKTGNAISRNEATRRLIKDVQELFGFEQFDINPSPDNTTLQLFIDDRSFRLHELGSGLAHFILAFGNVAVKEPTFILIDEPELGLHPSLQRTFLSRLARYASVGVLFATHSYGLASSSADQIYMFQRLAQGESKVSRLDDTTDLVRLLQDLTYSGYRDLRFEKILLVEGPTDLPVFRHFLRLLRKDHRIVLFSLGGDSMIDGRRGRELEELKRITSDIAAVIDREGSSADAPLAKNRQEFRAVCETADVRCHILARRAIENYFPSTVLQRIKGATYRALDPFERFSDVNLEWSKNRDNVDAALSMTLDDIRGTDLEQFLVSL